MAIRKTIQIGNNLLTAPNLDVTDFRSSKTRQVIEDLMDTMKNNPILAGISAPQIGENFKIFITSPRVERDITPEKDQRTRIFINPRITYFSPEVSMIYEGCGSVLDSQFWGPVIRPSEIIIKASDETGKEFTIQCNGILARVIQHEFDHLNGIQFVERISDYSKVMNLEYYKEFSRNNPEYKKAFNVTKCEVKSTN